MKKNPNKYVKISIIGLGNIGFLFEKDKNRIINKEYSYSYAISKSQKLSLVSASEKIQHKINMFKKKYPNTKIYQSVIKMLNNTSPDIVVIATPPEIHLQNFRDISKSKKKPYIICEKPISNNFNNAEKIYKIIKQNKLKCSINFSRRYLKSYRKIKNDIKKIGNILSVDAHFTGSVLNIGSHIIDAVKFLINEKKISVENICYKYKSSKEENFQYTNLRIRNFNFHLKRVYSKNFLDFEIVIRGAKGLIKILNNGKQYENYNILKSSKAKNYYDFKINKKILFKKESAMSNMLFEEMKNFQLNKSSVSNFENALNNMKLIDLLYD